MKNSLLLMGTAWVLSLAIAVPWGIHNSLRANGISDTIATLISFVVFSIPSFWLGIEMQVVFAYQLFWFPPSNMHSIAVNEKSLLDLAWHMVMPVIVLMFGFLASYLKHFRNSFLEVLSADFIRTARAKGASETRVLYRHALRNALIQIITVMAMDMPQLVGGSAFVELVFNWPGMGKELFTSAMIREYNMMMAIVIVTAMVVVIANWVADILYALVDPRIRVITRSQ
jgi:peptide/nickel transport system permease protein